jgi:O-methyltransferase
MDRISIINDLITKYDFKSYLEIGVRNTSECFDLINCETKDSVDPGFENPINNVKYKLTSDNFFKELNNGSLDKDLNYKWDIIFIDGLHLSYQVEQDITNSLNHLSENGIIVVHDCNPPTLHHAREDYSNHDTPAMGLWNGTVWKSFYKLRCTNPNLDMCVIDCDWGVGIIKKGSQTLCDLKNEYYEFSIFDKNRELSLNLIHFENFYSWLDKPFYEDKNIRLKLNFLKRILTDSLDDLSYTNFFKNGYPNHDIMENSLLQDISNDRLEGLDWPVKAHTMIGLKRLNNLHNMMDYIRINNIDGDLVETGVWRGGATIFMKAYVNFYNMNKKVFVCDSFSGLPEPDLEKYPQDIGDTHYSNNILNVSLEEVISNFKLYNLLDENVKFVKGWFSDTLVNNKEISKISILRCDGDMYMSTMDILENLYSKVTENGVIIIDDYCLPNCVKAVSDFRNKEEIKNDIDVIDNCGIFWYKKMKN